MSLTLHIGPDGSHPVRLLNDDGVDVLDGVGITAVRVDVLPGTFTTATFVVPVGSVVAEVDSRFVAVPTSQGVVATAEMPAIDLGGVADAMAT